MVDNKKGKLANLLNNNITNIDKKTAPTKPKFNNNTNTNNNLNKYSKQAYNGLKNYGNTCYSNVVMQSIITYKEFYYQLEIIVNKLTDKLDQKIIDSIFPALYNLYMSMNFYINKNSALSTKYLQTLAILFDPFQNQNDSHEYLIFILNKCHDEFLKLDNYLNEGINNNSKNSEDIYNETDSANNWEEVKLHGKRMKLTNKLSDFSNSFITELFGGILKHEIKKTGSSISNSNIEPFYILSIDSIHSNLEYSINNYFNKKEINGNSTIHQRSYLEKLPQLLILQIKCFYLDKQKKEVLKDNRKIIYDSILHVNDCWLSPSQKYDKNNLNIQYELFSVIVHQGSKISEGHYVCYCKDNLIQDESTINNRWIYINDNTLIKVNKEDVYNHRPYLMFYKKIN